MPAMTLCQICNKREASHYGYLDGKQLWRCCTCYVAAGGVPADWHPECMKAYAEKQKENSPAMTSMIEQVAGALAKLDTTDEGEHHQLCITAYADIARVAIAAMRKPTEAMLEAEAYGHRPTALRIWQSMIDAALKDKPKRRRHSITGLRPPPLASCRRYGSAQLIALRNIRNDLPAESKKHNTPTQAQIEAAAKVLNVSYENKSYAIKMAKAVLTAAAGVPDQEHILQKPGQKPGLLPSGNTAAGVGEKTTYGHLLGPGQEIRTKNATIERCAQAVKDCDTLGRTAVGFKEIAIAAIRALKEKP